MESSSLLSHSDQLCTQWWKRCWSFPFICVAGYFLDDIDMSAMCRHFADEKQTQSTLFLYFNREWNTHLRMQPWSTLWSSQAAMAHLINSTLQPHGSRCVSAIRQLIDDRQMDLNWHSADWSIGVFYPPRAKHSKFYSLAKITAICLLFRSLNVWCNAKSQADLSLFDLDERDSDSISD